MKTAVLVIDVQAGLFQTNPPPARATEVITLINSLTRRAREEGVPVVFIQHEGPGTELEHGSRGWALEQRLVVEPADQLIRKQTPDSFLGTDLECWLRKGGVEHLVIAGYATEFCVDTTVRRAAALGFSVTLASDAHTTHDKPHLAARLIVGHHNATLSDIESFGPRIEAIPTASIVFR